MPLYKVTTFKSLLNDESNPWTNVYTVEASDETDALDKGEEIVTVEATISKSNVVFQKITARQASVLSGSGRQRSLSGVVGGQTAVPADQLPLFNTVRVIFTDELGRSESKYLRLPLENTNVTGFFLDTTTRDDIANDYSSPLVIAGYLRGPQGELINGSFVQEEIQSRQRGWSRRSRPGQKRGWVPA